MNRKRSGVAKPYFVPVLVESKDDDSLESLLHELHVAILHHLRSETRSEILDISRVAYNIVHSSHPERYRFLVFKGITPNTTELKLLVDMHKWFLSVQVLESVQMYFSNLARLSPRLLQFLDGFKGFADCEQALLK